MRFTKRNTFFFRFYYEKAIIYFPLKSVHCFHMAVKIFISTYFQNLYVIGKYQKVDCSVVKKKKTIPLVHFFFHDFTFKTLIHFLWR